MGTQDRRLVAVSVHMDLLIDLMRKGKRVDHPIQCVNGMPEDAVFVGSIDDTYSNHVKFVFYHPSFDVVPSELMIPVISVTFQEDRSEAHLLSQLDRIAKSEINFEIDCFFDGGYTARMGDRANGYTATSPLCDTTKEAGEWIVEQSALAMSTR